MKRSFFLSAFALLAIATLSACDRKPPVTSSASTSVIAGSDKDPIYGVHDQDPVMNDAIKKARETVEDFKKILANPAGKESLSIKGAFTDGKETEHMWLEDVTYRGGFFKGKIGNDPDMVSNYKYGQTVTVKESEISDWMYVENGKLVGGYTIRALLKTIPSKDRKKFLRGLPFIIEEPPTSAK